MLYNRFSGKKEYKYCNNINIRGIYVDKYFIKLDVNLGGLCAKILIKELY